MLAGRSQPKGYPVDLEPFVDRIVGVLVPDRGWVRDRVRGVLEELVAAAQPAGPAPAQPTTLCPGEDQRDNSPALPKRSHAELARALRVRADYVVDVHWSMPATAAMMRAAADALEHVPAAEGLDVETLARETAQRISELPQCATDTTPNNLNCPNCGSAVPIILAALRAVAEGRS